MRQLPYACLAKRRAMDTGNIDGVPRSLRIELHQLRASKRGRERAISRMVPAARPNARSVAEPALHFIGDRCRQNHFLARSADAFADREQRREIITRMRRFLREISVVVIEVANLAAV